jgi:hypothetical protein
LVVVGRSVFIATVCAELLLLLFFTPAFLGGAIADERARGTLPLLLMTRLTRTEIVLTKGVARWLSTLSLILTGLPVIVASAWAAGLEAEMLVALVALLSSSAFMAALSLWASAARADAATARAQAKAWTFGWILAPPCLSILPINTGTLWGLLLAELKSLCVLVAPSSPLSLVTDHRWWYSPPLAASLAERVAEMVALQVLFGLIALAFAASWLQARERNPNWTDPTRGYRPPCGDDPIYWREYEMPLRRGGGSILALRLRLLVIYIRAMLINAGGLLSTLLTLAIPIGLLVATVYYGFAAFEELRQYGYGAIRPCWAYSRRWLWPTSSPAGSSTNARRGRGTCS